MARRTRSLPASPCLAGRQVQRVAQFLRGQVRIALHQRQKALVGFVNLDAGFLHDFSL